MLQNYFGISLQVLYNVHEVFLMIFKAYAITNEIDLNKIAAQCSIPKKYTWEEPLILENKALTNILGHITDPSELMLIFSFGSIVFINTNPQDEQLLLEYLKTIKPDLEQKNYRLYQDDYELRAAVMVTDETENLRFTDQYAIVPEIQPYHAELVSIVIAKSVALEKTEAQLEKILDTLEGTIDRLERGKLQIGDKELARTTAQIIQHEYNTIAYIMILDKPDITWANGDAAQFYELMSDFFELNDRYEILKQKTNVLNVIIGHFASISHSMRGLFIEWLIVGLILVEVVLMIMDLVK